MPGPGSLRRAIFLSIFVALLTGLLPKSLIAQQSSVPAWDATDLRKPKALDMTWLIQPGDDLAYAASGFDDSHWRPFDPHASIVPLYGATKPAVIWYRMHIKVDPTDADLAISEYQISRAFEIYASGERILVSGSVAPFQSYTSTARMLARIPQRLLASGNLVLALRVHITETEWTNGQDPGYYAENLQIGDYDTLYRETWLTIIGQNALDWMDRFLSICLGAVALVLFLAQRREAEYRWIAIAGALTLVQSPEPLVAAFRNIPTHWELLSDISKIATPYVFVSLYFSFVHQRIGWRWRTFLIFAGICNFLTSVQGLLFTTGARFQLLSNIPFIILISVVVPVVLATRWWRGNREAGILLVPIVLFSAYVYVKVALGTMFQFPSCRDAAIQGIMFIDHYAAGPFEISFQEVFSIMSTLALAVIMLQRSTTTAKRQAQLESEFEAAQQVQQVLVPERTEPIPGFEVESVYLPAQQVGGDFFQVLPDGDGGVLVIVGDVAGKGLPAAMLVSVLVGAIRATAEFSYDPGELLRNLNDRLVGRAGGGFSTALVAHLTADGLVRIANAGHLSPYLDGQEIELPGALPLGVASGTRYEMTEIELPPGSRLTFYSDGVVEAQSRTGELFGFERTCAISRRPAQEIAEEAKRFGQQDDITVLTVERVGVAVSAA